MRQRVLLVLLLLAIMIVSSITPPRSAAQGGSQRVRLPLLMRAYVPQPPPKEGSSDQLIDAALARGEIDAETALIYKVFAAFGDARLPGRFQGDDSKLFDSHVVAQVQAQYAALSEAARATLNPFLIPPIYVGSWADPSLGARQPAGSASRSAAERGWMGFGQQPPLRSATAQENVVIVPCTDIFPGWTHKDSANVRVWWRTNRPGDAAAADGYLAAMEGVIWPKLVPLMGRQPISDGPLACNGGDGKLDIYIEPRAPFSQAPANNTPGCRATSAYIVLKPGVSDGILAHEFMHTIQWAFNTRDGCMYPGEYAWLAEATATWAQDFVYPLQNEENYLAADYYFLEDAIRSLEFTNQAHEYGAYIFFYYLTRKGSDDNLVRRAWLNTESHDSLEAVNSAIPGGYATVWHDFALYNWNAAPYDDYTQWDGTTTRAKPHLGKEEIDGPGLWPMTSTTPHLGLIYKHFVFSGESARLVTFVNGLTYKVSKEPIDQLVGITTVSDGSEIFAFADLPEEAPGVKVQALFRIEGDSGWQLEDWTGRPHVSFCRDVASERLAELVIIMSNSEYFPRDRSAEPEGLPCQLQVSDMGCYRFTGSAAARTWGQGTNGTFDNTQEVRDLVFERMPNEAHPNIPYPYLSFRVIEGQYRHEYTVESEDGCYGHAVDSAALGPTQTLNHLWTLPGVISGASQGRYLGYADAMRLMSVTVACPGGAGSYEVYPTNWFGPSVLGQVLGKAYTAGALGELKGSDKYPVENENAEISFTWDLAPQREP